MDCRTNCLVRQSLLKLKGVHMKKLFLIILAVCCLFMPGCGRQKSDQTEGYAVWESGGGGYLTSDGYYFTRDSENDAAGILLYYYDRSSGVTVPVCDKAECSHQAVDLSSGEQPVCNAQICTYTDFLVYEDKIYYMSGQDMNLVLRSRDTDGNHDKKVAVLEASELGGRMWFYRDCAFVMASTDVSQSFDPETRESEQSVMRLFVIDLDSGETEILAESSLTEAVNYAFNIYRMTEGEVCFYDLEKDEWFVYDTEKKKLELQEVQANARYGEYGEYVDIYGDFCYDIFTDASGNGSIMRLDRNSGEESVIYSGTPGCETGYMIWDMDCMYITEINSQIENICYYDMNSGEMTQLSGSLYHDPGMMLPFSGDEKGFVYMYAVDMKEDQVLYTGDMECRYMTLEDAVEGNGNYQVIYYLEQEEE